MHVQPPVPVVCAVIVRDDLIMIAQRPQGRKLGGFWEFPGGKVEHGETAEAALHRELCEELGCAVSVLKALPSFVHAYPWGSIELIPFICELAPGSAEPHPHEHAAIAWVTRGQLATYHLAPADVPVLSSLS